MLLESWLNQSTKKLELAGIESSRLDSLIILEDVLGLDRSWVLANPDHNLSAKDRSTLDTMVDARLKHIPIAYIRGKCEFYGREFVVSESTLQPRSETEVIIEILLELNLKSEFIIIDIGTGSGCLAITAKLELPSNKVFASDISNEALKIAKINCKNLNANIKIIKSDLLENFEYIEAPYIIISNLPYIPKHYPINKSAEHEPKLALFGGNDGLDLYRKLFSQAKELQFKPKLILTESLASQHNELVKIAKCNNYKFIKSKDLIQVFSAT